MTLDISHQWGGDLDVGSSGDLAVVASPISGSQRILRRLLTNPGDYIWNLTYGAGLSRFVGQVGSTSHIRAVIQSQMMEEPAVIRYPRPTVEIVNPAGDRSGIFLANISYRENLGGEISTITVPIIG